MGLEVVLVPLQYTVHSMGMLCLAVLVACGSGQEAASMPDGGDGDASYSESLGEEECPIVDGACPSGCSPIMGSRIDTRWNCLLEEEIVACGMNVADIRHPGTDCYFHLETGDIYKLSGLFTLEEPQYVGWRVCTNDERSYSVSVGPCSRR